MKDLLRSLISWILAALTFVVFAPAILIILILPRFRLLNNRFAFALANLFYSLIARCLLVPITYVRTQQLKSKPLIIVVNHESSLDIVLAGAALQGHPHVWMAWSDLAKSGFFRFFLPKVAILIDLSSPLRSGRSLVEAVRLLKDSDAHVVIFPEGGRFIDGEIHDFFGGFGILARKMNRAVVPLYIHNAGTVFPPGAVLTHYAPITVVTGPHFVPDAQESDDTFKERVRSWFVEQNKQMRK